MKIIATAPNDGSYFFGFHDVSPWNADGSKILLHRVDPALRRMPDLGDIAEIVLWSSENNTVEKIGETTTWNFQQGARAMWLPGAGRRVIYNRAVGGSPGSEIVDIDTGERKQLPHAVGSVAPDGNHALAPNFGRLGAHWKAYGYVGFEHSSDHEPLPHDDGLWLIDLDSGARQLLYSVSDLALSAKDSIPPNVKAFVTHASYNREGTKAVFMLRYFSKDIALFSILFSCNPDGSDLRVLCQEKVSHFDWIDEKRLLIWMRRAPSGLAAARRSGLLANPLVKPIVQIARSIKGSMKGRLLNESYFILDSETARATPFMNVSLQQDGHPMISADRRYLVTDEYPDGQSQEMPLIVVDLNNQEKFEIGRFRHDIGSSDTDIKCDLHPRWHPTKRWIGIDASVGGCRKFTIVDVADEISLGQS